MESLTLIVNAIEGGAGIDVVTCYVRPSIARLYAFALLRRPPFHFEPDNFDKLALCYRPRELFCRLT